jgi:hypothetical protein
METPMYLHGTKKRLWEWTFIEASPRMVSNGIASEEEIESVIRGHGIHSRRRAGACRAMAHGSNVGDEVKRGSDRP